MQVLAIVLLVFSNCSECGKNIFYDKESRNQLHVIWADKDLSCWSEDLFKREMKRYNLKSAVVSVVNLWKHQCLSQEEFDIEYGKKSKIHGYNGPEDYSLQD